MSWVRRVVRHDGLFDARLSLDADTPITRLYDRWLRDLTAELGLVWHDRLVHMPTYLQFRDVEFHNDGRLLFDAQEEDHFYVNLQLAGSGWLDLKVGRQTVQSHYIAPGNLYLFDQRLEHAWRSDGRALCKLFSIAVPLSAALDLQARYRAPASR